MVNLHHIDVDKYVDAESEFFFQYGQMAAK